MGLVPGRKDLLSSHLVLIQIRNGFPSVVGFSLSSFEVTVALMSRLYLLIFKVIQAVVLLYMFLKLYSHIAASSLRFRCGFSLRISVFARIVKVPGTFMNPGWGMLSACA